MTPLLALLLAAAGTAQVTPAMLADAVQCWSRDAHDAIRRALYASTPPDWIHDRDDSGDDTLDLIGMRTYALDTPITVFGQSVDHFSLYADWMVVALPRATAKSVIARRKLTLAPIATTQQYYRFLNPDHGPMLGAFESPNRALTIAFGGSVDDIPPPETLFVGCNYLFITEAQFLDMAKQADARIHGAADDIRDAAKGMESTEPSADQSNSPDK